MADWEMENHLLTRGFYGIYQVLCMWRGSFAKPQQLLGNTLMAMFGCPHQGGHALLLTELAIPEDRFLAQLGDKDPTH